MVNTVGPLSGIEQERIRGRIPPCTENSSKIFSFAGVWAAASDWEYSEQEAGESDLLFSSDLPK